MVDNIHGQLYDTGSFILNQILSYAMNRSVSRWLSWDGRGLSINLADNASMPLPEEDLASASVPSDETSWHGTFLDGHGIGIVLGLGPAFDREIVRP